MDTFTPGITEEKFYTYDENPYDKNFYNKCRNIIKELLVGITNNFSRKIEYKPYHYSDDTWIKVKKQRDRTTVAFGISFEDEHYECYNYNVESDDMLLIEQLFFTISCLGIHYYYTHECGNHYRYKRWDKIPLEIPINDINLQRHFIRYYLGSTVEGPKVVFRASHDEVPQTYIYSNDNIKTKCIGTHMCTRSYLINCTETLSSMFPDVPTTSYSTKDLLDIMIAASHVLGPVNDPKIIIDYFRYGPEGIGADLCNNMNKKRSGQRVRSNSAYF